MKREVCTRPWLVVGGAALPPLARYGIIPCAHIFNVIDLSKGLQNAPRFRTSSTSDYDGFMALAGIEFP
jgi:hypothetical protein